MGIYNGEEYIDTFCEYCNKTTCHTYVKIDTKIPGNNPDIIVKCEICSKTKYVSEKNWTMNCYFEKEDD